ncbi:MAG: cupin domain-containing protein [Dehalococcoidia bacterium]|nr:cupin domain-containing protein [Dehalococcoidia bacterium]
MRTFYDNWLQMWDQAAAEKKAARKSIHEDELEWVSTPQDRRVALLIAPETGFRTWGTASMLAEIPVGWHTGKHKHGEEAIHFVEGEGFSVVNGKRYDWKTGSTMAIPFGVEHQHFNTGSTTARYYALLSPHLEHFVGIHRTTQLEECGETGSVPDVPASANGLDDEGRRIVLHYADAPVRRGAEGEKPPVLDPNKPMILGDTEGMAKMAAHHKSEYVDFMSTRKEMNDFKVFEQEFSGILTDSPREYGGTHAHMEAILYILDGEGYTIADGEKIPWRKGSSLHIQGPQTVHQHVNESDVPSRMLRAAPGIRYFFERMAKNEFPYLYISMRQAVVEGSKAGAS